MVLQNLLQKYVITVSYMSQIRELLLMHSFELPINTTFTIHIAPIEYYGMIHGRLYHSYIETKTCDICISKCPFIDSDERYSGIMQ